MRSEFSSTLLFVVVQIQTGGISPGNCVYVVQSLGCLSCLKLH